MNLVSHSPAEAELAQLLERFDHWRQTRTTRHEPIPDWLWDQAIQLTSPLPCLALPNAYASTGKS